MSAISGYISTIQNAVYGEQVRTAIVNALEACYSDVENPDLQSAAFQTAIEAAYQDGILDIITVTSFNDMTNQSIIYRYNGTAAGKQKGLYYYSALSSSWVLIGSEIQKVSLASQMTDVNDIYKYIGTESGMVQNSLYFHNGTSWVPIGSGVLTASTAAQMTNTDAIYKYTGSETGYIANALYYYNGTNWAVLSNENVDSRLSALENAEKTVFFGKSLSVYGDSLTEANSHYSVGYYAWIKTILGFASVVNHGVSGYTTESVYNKLNDTTYETDVISIMCGVNDQTFNVPLGTPADTTLGTTYGNVYKICELVKTKYPTSIIFFITPHFQTKYPHSGGITSYEVSRAIIEVCTKFSIPVYDNYVFSGICASNLSVFTTDGCHWNNVGHEMVGKNIAKWMDDTFRYIYPRSEGGGGDEGDEGDEDYLNGYTMSITGNYRGDVHLVQLIKSQYLSVGDTVNCVIECHSATSELTTSNSNTSAYFTDSSGEVGNGLFVKGYGHCNTSISKVGTSYTISSSFTVSTLGTEYIKTVNRLTTPPPFSFVIDRVTASVGNTPIPIDKFGTFFQAETFTLTAPN